MSMTPEIWIACDKRGTIRRWLQAVVWTTCEPGNKLCDSLITDGYPGDPVEYVEAVLACFEHAGLITRGAPDPMLQRSGLAWSAAFTSVRFEEKRRCFAWLSTPALVEFVKTHPAPRA